MSTHQNNLIKNELKNILNDFESGINTEFSTNLLEHQKLEKIEELQNDVISLQHILNNLLPKLKSVQNLINIEFIEDEGLKEKDFIFIKSIYLGNIIIDSIQLLNTIELSRK